MKRPELIPNWRRAPRLWSVQLSVAGSAITAALVALPEAALWAWNVMPHDWKSAVPPDYMPLVGVAFMLLAPIARVIKQQGDENA